MVLMRNKKNCHQILPLFWSQEFHPAHKVEFEDSYGEMVKFSRDCSSITPVQSSSNKEQQHAENVK